MARALQAAGWTRARALVGGWAGWIEAGLPTEPPQPARPLTAMPPRTR